jgi:hypothetical protein
MQPLEDINHAGPLGKNSFYSLDLRLMPGIYLPGILVLPVWKSLRYLPVFNASL